MKWNEYNSTFWLSGLSLGLAISTYVINISTTISEIKYPITEIEWEEIFPDTIPLTAQTSLRVKKPKTQDLKTFVVEEILEDLLVEAEDDYELDDTEIGEDEGLDIGSNFIDEKPKKVIVPIEEEKEDAVLFRAERMPCFEDCIEYSEELERQDCTSKKLLELIYDRLVYPSVARENHIEGRVTVQFIVNKTGETKDIKILRDIGGGCGEATIKAIKQLPIWIPGKQNGRPVSVLYTLPVSFKLVN